MPVPIVRHQSVAPTVPCPCGFSTRIITSADEAPGSLHVTRIQDSTRHYHKATSEIYYILRGHGRIELDGTWHAIQPGSSVFIPSGCRHRLSADPGTEVETIVIAIPAFDPADEWFD
jgi:mannose-6-phosphate isomerase-like protein (cupin superfamily)